MCRATNVFSRGFLFAALIFTSQLFADEYVVELLGQQKNYYFNEFSDVGVNKDKPFIGRLVYDSTAANGHAACIFIQMNSGKVSLITGFDGEKDRGWYWAPHMRTFMSAPNAPAVRDSHPCKMLVTLKEAIDGNGSGHFSDIKISNRKIDAKVDAMSLKVLSTYGGGFAKLPQYIFVLDDEGNTKALLNFSSAATSSSHNRYFRRAKTVEDEKFEASVSSGLGSSYSLGTVQLALKRLVKQYR